MPALDSLMGGGATHIADQNSVTPIKTLCGQALDKPTTRYFADRANFEHVTCKICRQIYFGESWGGSKPEETPAQPDQASADAPPAEPTECVEKAPNTTSLFSNLTRPINTHASAEDA